MKSELHGVKGELARMRQTMVVLTEMNQRLVNEKATMFECIARLALRRAALPVSE